MIACSANINSLIEKECLESGFDKLYKIPVTCQCIIPGGNTTEQNDYSCTDGTIGSCPAK